ncbi:MAG: cysteine--tRNA ligase [Chloroflexi bacterium]|nr:cysteine--tRNA ligase [Chloroflexota bacterium]
MLRIYNTLHKRIEEVKTLEPGVARMYTCGPTVYRYAHIGNLRSYLMADWIRRALMNQGVKVIHVKNITDVGHMRQEQLERGGDKVILAALAEGKTPQEIADFYTEAFHQDESKLNILSADHFPRATGHITEMLEVIQRLMDNGSAYGAGGNIYFDVANYAPYGQLSGNLGEELLEGVRVEVDPLKRDPRDFTLWKGAEAGRDVKWDSPWGQGFPGWHIECSAMSTRYLGEEQDIHTGGVDNIFPHHEGEIAQSEAAFGKRYVRYWVHGQHLLADGVKMSKSSGNEFTLPDLEGRGFDPLSFRYLCLTVKYRNRLNFTFTALKAAQRGLTRLRDRVWTWRRAPSGNGRQGKETKEWQQRFWDAVDDDLNLPRALSVAWTVVHSSLADQTKLELLLEFDQLLGLGLAEGSGSFVLPRETQNSLADRESYRVRSRYERADEIRRLLGIRGYQIRDTKEGPMARPKTSFELLEERWPSVSSSREVPSYIDSPSTTDYSLVVSASDYLEDVKRCLNSAFKWSSGSSMEVVAVDNGSTDGTAEWLEELQASNDKVRVVHCDHQLGEAQAKNIGLTQSRGRIVVMLDTSIELTDIFLPRIKGLLEDQAVGVVGTWGIRSEDLHHFHEEVVSGEADAMQGYCFAFRRELLREVGLMRECFRFYRNLDLDFSFQFRNLGYRIVADGTLPMVRHEHRQWSALGEEERDQLSRRNFNHFLKRWGNRKDLLLANAHH